MQQIDTRPVWQSATKIVFLILTVALVVGLFVWKVKDTDFIILVGQVFAFYFGQKYGQANAQQSQQTDTKDNVNSKNG